MDSLIYASTATRDFSEADLLDLLATARTMNASLGVTGLLLYSPGDGRQRGTFVQALEGERPVLRELYGKIIRDPRHENPTVIQEGERFTRRFPDWTMGFRNLATLTPDEVPGFNPIFLQNWTLAKVLAEPDPVFQLLYSFAGV